MTRRALLLVASLLLAAAARPAYPATPAPGELLVFAAASLREVFEHLAADFERRHQGVKVHLSFAGSQELRTQIEHGAQPDVFASADVRQMALLRDAGLVRSPVVFTRNRPVVVVPAANPARLATFAELPKATRVVLGASEVPVGAYADAILLAAAKHLGEPFRAQVVAHVCSRELNARQVLTKVVLGEADAGIVYQSDALAARKRVRAIPIPEPINVVARYPIAALTAAPHPELADAWIAAVLGRAAQDALAAAGFIPVRSATKGRGGS